ncbi:MAG: hypothetical protein J6Q14_01040 [Oscillospiraceae bacterium]|nr:hypothetical protein [Oscillospiraceae bacterium]
MLKFEISGQKMTRVDTFAPATDSKLYLKAAFTFSSDWASAAKTAIFRDEVTGESYGAPLNSSGVCTVPAEVLARSTAVHYQTQGNHFHVSLRGDIGSTLITTNEVKVELARSGYTEGQTPAAPSPDAYSQFVANVKADADRAVASAEAAAASASNVANLYANALKKKVRGETVRAGDVSPVEHELGVQVRGVNLLPLPYDAGTQTVSGVTYTVNGDGSVSVKGTATANAAFYLARELTGLTGTVYLRGCPAGGSTSAAGYSIRLNRFLDGAEVTGCADTGEGGHVTLNGETVRVYIVVLTGGTVDLTFWPVLTYDETVAEYVPRAELSAVTVSRYGRNVLNLANCSLAGCVVHGQGVRANISGAYYMELYANYLKEIVQSRDGKALTFSVGNVATNSYIALVLMYTDGTYAQKSSTSRSVTLWLDHQGRTVQHVLLRPMAKSEKFNDTTAVISNLMLEFSDTMSDFEPYKGSTAHATAADGTVEGVKSLSPNVTLLTDTPGVTIEATYHRDLIKVIAALEAALLN